MVPELVVPTRIVSVHPDLLGTYGDRGNVRVLAQRLALRGLAAEVVTVNVHDPLPLDADLYVLGGGEDAAQLTALEALHRAGLARAVAEGAHVLAVCAGFQLLGRTLEGPDGQVVEGLGVLDATTVRLAERVVGEVVAQPTDGAAFPLLSGFANHQGGTRLHGAAQPLATTLTGGGNEGAGHSAEGALQGRVVATYLHGPVLVRNPGFADWLLERVLGHALPPLPRDVPEQLHDHLVHQVAGPGQPDGRSSSLTCTKAV